MMLLGRFLVSAFIQLHLCPQSLLEQTRTTLSCTSVWDKMPTLYMRAAVCKACRACFVQQKYFR